VAPHGNEERNYWDDLTLDHALSVLEIRDMFQDGSLPAEDHA